MKLGITSPTWTLCGQFHRLLPKVNACQIKTQCKKAHVVGCVGVSRIVLLIECLRPTQSKNKPAYSLAAVARNAFHPVTNTTLFTPRCRHRFEFSHSLQTVLFQHRLPARSIFKKLLLQTPWSDIFFCSMRCCGKWLIRKTVCLCSHIAFRYATRWPARR